MPREDIEFKTSDNVTLRGWFYKPETSSTTPLPCLVVSHGFSALKEMSLDTFAERFSSALPISYLVYDNRGFGASDNHPSAPRLEIIPALQRADISDAITYAQSREDVNKDNIGIWGSSFSGGRVLKAVLSQGPFVSGWETFERLIRPDLVGGLNTLFQEHRLARAAGKAAGILPVIDPNSMATSALPTADLYEFFAEWAKKCDWKNEVTIRTLEEAQAYNPYFHIHHISPAPLPMTVSDNDTLTPTDLALRAYARALEPKELHILPGGHFTVYGSPTFGKNVAYQIAFLKKTLCA